MASLFKFFKRPTAAAAAADPLPATVTPAGMTTGARPLASPVYGGNYTPAAIEQILLNAETGEENALATYFKLVDRVMEREFQTSGVLNGLVLAIAGLVHKAVPVDGDKSKKAAKMADEITALLKPSSALRRITPGVISQGISHSIGASAVQWDTRSTPWVPARFIQKPAHFFTFDRTDGFTPLLRNELAGQPATEILPGTAIVFTPHRNASLQIKNGLGWILCWAYQIKSAVLADELLFVQTFGHPLVTGKYPRGTSPEEIGFLSRAVNSLNATFRGVFRDDLKIEFQEIARSNTDIYEKVSRYVDELIAKVIWANTLSSEVGQSSSHALGKVHAEAKYDVIKAYAQQWAACLQEFFDAYVEWNYGPTAPKVQIIVDVDGAEDFLTKSMVLKNLYDSGVTLIATEVRQAFGYSEPQPGDEVVSLANAPLPPMPNAPGAAPAAAAPPVPPALPAPEVPAKAPTPAANARVPLDLGAGCPLHAANALAPARDHIDDLADQMLSDWAVISGHIDTTLHAAASGAGDLEQMRTAMLTAVQDMDVTALNALLTKARTATRLAGDLGADL